jgi:hypothetical protein
LEFTIPPVPGEPLLPAREALLPALAKPRQEFAAPKPLVLFVPPVGWPLSAREGLNIAKAPDESSAVAFASYVGFAGAAQESAARTDALAELQKELEVAVAQLERAINWKKPDDTRTVRGMAVRLWQPNAAATRRQTKGILLVVEVGVRFGEGAVGLGFVPADDASGADAEIMQVVESLRRAD